MPRSTLFRTVGTAAVVGALLSATLVGCTSSTSSTSPAPQSSSGCTGTPSGSASASIKATGKWGSEPKVSFDKGLSTSSTQKSTLIQGKGAVVKKGQPVIFQVSLYDGKTGAKATTTDYTTSGATLVAGPGAALSALSQGFVCSRVGDRIAIAGSPKDSTDDKGLSQYKIAPGDSVVFVADILNTFPGRATGKAQPPVAGQPSVTLGSNGAPTIKVPSTPAPETLQATTLIKGSGATVAEGDTLMLQYTGALYKDGSVFDSSWTRGEPLVASLSQGQLITGWVKGLAGQTVGSQVLLVIPPADGYGATAQGTSIPANSTLVFVVDILGKVS